MRVSTFPTLYGERAVVRVFARAGTHQELDQLGLPPDLAQRLRALLSETSGALVISGPVGSGKSTTAYACLRELVRSTHGGRSICSLEDPIESVVDGVSQSQVNPASDFTLLTGLKSLLRQDPEVMMIGEIRDAATAEVCLQASLTGQLVVTTFHAGNAAEAVGRLLDMGIEPYVLRSGILAVLNQRLMRRLCDCAVISGESGERWGMHLRKMPRQAAGCANCYGTGYRGRLLLAEWMEIKHGPLGDAIASRQNVRSLQQQAVRAGMAPLWSRAVDAVEQGWTSPEEVCRVLGLHRNNYGDDPITRDSAEP
jgi:type II secretory ATPase GspE/PulE/Tfp pilus assembly ATPase PilB-like protein